MAYPNDWDAIDDKLKQLFPGSPERGNVRRKLFQLDTETALRYFRDTDTSVKITLDPFTEGDVRREEIRQMCIDRMCAVRQAVLKQALTVPRVSIYDLMRPPSSRLLDFRYPMHNFVQGLPKVRQQILEPISGSVITLDSPWLGNSTVFGCELYVRPCYNELLQASWRYRERKAWFKGTLIAGTPGIGKSHLAALVVAQLLLLGRVVLLELVGSTADIKRQFFRLQLTSEGKAIVHSVSNSEDAMEWLMYDTQAVTDVKDLEEFAPAYVVDGGMPSLAFGSFPNFGRCFWQFSSAQPDILKEVRKGSDYMDFYPPLFSLKELLHLKASISTFATLPDEQVAQGFAMMGGIARTVLRALSRNKTLKEMRDSIKSKIANLGEDGWRKAYDTLKGETGFHGGSDAIVHWDAVDPDSLDPRQEDSPEDAKIRRYTKHRSQLASPYVAALLSIHMGRANAERASMFCISHGTRGGPGGLVGKLHEELSHIGLAAGDEFECRLIHNGAEFTLKLDRSTDVEVFQSTAEAVALASAAVDGSCYLMPASQTYPAIDAMKTAAILFQMAAGKQHTINRPGLSALIRGFSPAQMRAAVKHLRSVTGLTREQLPGCKPILFFVTMPESYDDGYKALQKYVEGKKVVRQGQLAHQAVLKIPHKLLEQMSAKQQAAIVEQIAQQLREFQEMEVEDEDEEALPEYMEEADMDEDPPDAN